MPGLQCKKCDLRLGYYEQDEDGTQFYRMGQPVGAKFLNYRRSFKERKIVHFPIPIICPRCDTKNYVKDLPEAIEKLKNESLNFGQPCTTHPDVLKGLKVICNKSIPCDQCIAKEHYEALKNGKLLR